MKATIAALMIALTVPGLLILLSAPSSAQFRSVKDGKQDPNAGSKKKVDDSQYKAAIDRMPEKKFDPWRDLR